MTGRAKVAEDVHRGRAWTVWHGEALARTKTMPPLAKLIGKPPAKQAPAEILAIFQTMKAGGIPMTISKRSPVQS